jgi:cell volume regulation protein A
VARRLGLELPRQPEPPQRIDVDLPASGDRDMVVYTVRPMSPATGRGLRRRLLLERAAFVSVIRDGRALDPRWLDHLEPGDSAIVIAPPDRLSALDRLFTGPSAQGQQRDVEVFGEFVLDGHARTGEIAAFYEFPVPDDERDETLGGFVARHLGRQPVVGDRLRVGGIELIVRRVDDDGAIGQVGIELEPPPPADWHPVARLRARLGSWLAAAARRLRAVVRFRSPRPGSPRRA